MAKGFPRSRQTVRKKLTGIKELPAFLQKKPVGEGVHPNNSPGSHVSVRAGAGCGKTTTMEWGYNAQIKGIKPPYKPSVSQEAIIESFNGTAPTASVKFVCFNSSVKDEFVNRGLPGSTNHSLGFAAVRNSFRGVQIDKGGWGANNYCVDIEHLDPKKDWETIKLTSRMVSLSKMTLAGWRPGMRFDELCPPDIWAEDFHGLINHYGIDLNGKDDTIMSLVPKILNHQASQVGRIGFDDMIWLPVVRNLPLEQHDLLIVDERQDLNRCQMELLVRSGERIIGVGDKFQAIYGFAGADAESFERMDAWMSQSPRGIASYPLMETRRCPKCVVELAQTLVPEFTALPEAPPGRIHRDISWDVLLGEKPSPAGTDLACRKGDMLLCRVNAPLIQMVYRFIREGITAHIQGRDIGEGLLSMVKKSKADDIGQLISWGEDQRNKETEKAMKSKFPSESKLQAINDKYDCLAHLCVSCDTINALVDRINTIFPERQPDRANTITLSSVHRAKGLEAKRVYILCPEKMPLIFKNAQPWEIAQEKNVCYVAWTRTKDQLIFTTTPQSKNKGLEE